MSVRCCVDVQLRYQVEIHSVDMYLGVSSLYAHGEHVHGFHILGTAVTEVRLCGTGLLPV